MRETSGADHPQKPRNVGEQQRHDSQLRTGVPGLLRASRTARQVQTQAAGQQRRCLPRRWQGLVDGGAGVEGFQDLTAALGSVAGRVGAQQPTVAAFEIGVHALPRADRGDVRRVTILAALVILTASTSSAARPSSVSR